MLPNISVVIPSFKSGPWIEQTIGSVLAQTYPLEKIELIIVDDASPDDTVRLARKLLDASPMKSRIIVREKNVGVAMNRNAGWRAAGGDWIQFLDHDDVILPHKLQSQVDCVARAGREVDVVYSPWQAIELIDGRWQANGPVRASNLGDDTVAGMLKDEAFGYVGPALFRKTRLAGVGGFGEQPNLGEDTDLMLRLAMGGATFLRSADDNAPAFLYRQTPGSLWQSYTKNPIALWNLLLTFRMAEQFLREQRPGAALPDDVRRVLAAHYGRRIPFFVEQDPQKFATVVSWLDALGYPVPPNLGPKMKVASKAIGFRNALVLHNNLRGFASKLQSIRRGRSTPSADSTLANA